MDLHDPRIKQRIKDALYEVLYGPVQENYRKRLAEIVQENCRLQKNDHPSFIYRGITYTSDSTRPMPRKLNRLHDKLRPVMDQYLKETKELNEVELPYVLGFINQVLNSSNDLQDYLRILPESVHRPIEDIIRQFNFRTMSLDENRVEELKARNKRSIELMKQRQVLNLLL